jgi:transcriptional regulator with XRE-family HTH domain
MAFLTDADQPAEPRRQYIGLVLRYLREQAGLTQQQLGEKISWTCTLIAHIEAGRRAATPEFVEAVDAALDCSGLLKAGFHLAATTEHTRTRLIHPELEEDAPYLHYWAPYTIPDVLQTDSYARALHHYRHPSLTRDEVEQDVEKQRNHLDTLLALRPAGAELVAILDQAALLRHVGGPQVMHDQLLHLAERTEEPGVTIQVLPLHSEHYPALMQPAALAERWAERGRTPHHNVFVEGRDGVTWLYKSAQAESFIRHMANLRAYALSPESSAGLIREMAWGLKEKEGQRRR